MHLLYGSQNGNIVDNLSDGEDFVGELAGVAVTLMCPVCDREWHWNCPTDR
jgi:hypothetical protein